MKLYATVTSERASKGQGGEYLDIEIKNEDKICFATIKVRNQCMEIWHDGKTEVVAYKDSAWNRDIYESPYQKGKQQKDEICPLNHEWDEQGHCKNCPAQHCKCHN